MAYLAEDCGGMQRLRLVVFQEAPGVWLARGLEHDVFAEARTVGAVVRAAVRLVEAQAAFDVRHHHAPLTAFRPAPQTYWNAFTSGSPLSLEQLGVVAPA